MVEDKCVWWNMAGAKSQSALLLNLLKEDCVVEKLPKVAQKEVHALLQVKGEMASWGNNVYVLHFKHFRLVRKPRCKGMFLCLQDLTDFFFFFLSYFPIFLSPRATTERQSLTLHHHNTQRIFFLELNMHTGWMFCFFLKFTMWAKCVFLTVSHTFKFVKWNLKK